MKDVKLFIASSAELNADKELFDLFLSEKNKVYKSRYIFFSHRTWRDFISSVSNTRLQDRYNDYIKECDIVVFLFHTKVGKYTLEEFRIAHTQFLKSGGKSPQIYLYYKDSPFAIKEIDEFKAMDIARGHFYDTYSCNDELINKFNKQLELLENDGFISPQRIDIPKLVKYALLCVLLPLVIVTLSFFAFYWYKPQDVSINIAPQQTEFLQFNKGKVTLTYANKSESKDIDNKNLETIFNNIHSRYMNKHVSINILADGYNSIDTTLILRERITISLIRDSSLASIYGEVMDEKEQPIANATVAVGKITATTNSVGQFNISIPLALQNYEQRVIVFKNGYQRWDFTGAVSKNSTWRIVMRR